MYSQATHQTQSDLEFLAEIATRIMLKGLALWVAFTIALVWLPTVATSVCSGTTVLGVQTVCLLKTPTQATLEVAGLKEGTVIVKAGQDAAASATDGVKGLSEGLTKQGSGSSMKVRRSINGMSDVNKALSTAP